MKAVIVKDVGVLEVQDLPEPEPESDQIKIKIAYAGICGSDPKVVDRKGGRAPINGAIGWPPKSARQVQVQKYWGTKLPARL